MTDAEHILLSAVRYSLGRQTYIVADCARWVRDRWPSLSEQCQSLIYRDVSEEYNRPNFFTEIDRPVWFELIVWMAAHRQESKKTDETVTVPREALQFVLDCGCFEDEGPAPEGWKSDEMIHAITSLEKALKR